MPAPLLQRFANPRRFLHLADRLIPVTALLGGMALMTGCYMALVTSPPDYQQGEAVRIMYVHVPAAWMGLFIYATMAVAAITGFVWRHVVAELYARAAAPLGAGLTLICLVTGSLWGKPMWGTWWVWDARLTSVLVLFFFYAGYMALVDAFDDEQKGLNAGAVLLAIGLINLPIIKFSVDWWQTLHQPASILRRDGIAIDSSMLWPLLTMAAGFKLSFISLVLLRLKTEITKRRMAARMTGENT